MQAHQEFKSIMGCVAFNITGHIQKRKLNQWVTSYTFKDGSILYIHGPKRFARAATGPGDYTTIAIGNLFELKGEIT